MPNTYTVYTRGESLATNKSILAIWNPTSSGKVIRVYRIGLFNHNTISFSGSTSQMSIYTISSCSGGASKSFMSHDTNNPSIPGETGILATSGGTVSDSTLLRRVFWSNDEAVANDSTSSGWQGLPILLTLWDVGYENTNIQPLTLTENTGIHIKCTATTTAGSISVWIEMTINDE